MMIILALATQITSVVIWVVIASTGSKQDLFQSKVYEEGDLPGCGSLFTVSVQLPCRAKKKNV